MRPGILLCNISYVRRKDATIYLLILCLALLASSIAGYINGILTYCCDILLDMHGRFRLGFLKTNHQTESKRAHPMKK
jgi:hypothetical protein